MRAHRRRRNPKKADSPYDNIYECRFARPATNVGGKSCHNKQYRGYWAEPLVTRAVQEMARRLELASAAMAAYRKVQNSKQLQPDIKQLQQQLAELEKQEQATVKAQIAGVMAGADSGIYESMLRDSATKRGHIMTVLTRAGQHPAGKKGVEVIKHPHP